MAALVRLLSACGGEEGRAGLGVLLCEVLTAVFLSLFVHGLATHSSAQLFRVLAHPLNSKLWVAVFGGGARLPTSASGTSITAQPPTGERWRGHYSCGDRRACLHGSRYLVLFWFF